MRVVEQFVSINGEGRRAGQLALFVRFAGCNLNCEYCDTKWANEKTVDYLDCSPEEIVEMAKESGVKNVTLTGGEPLIQEEMKQLLKLFRKETNLRIEVETNGSVDITGFLDGNHNCDVVDTVSFTLDYKTSASGMEHKMCLSNYANLRSQDTVKFVVGCEGDLQRAKDVIEEYRLLEKGCGIYISPCFGAIEPSDLVDFLVKENLNDVNIQLQLHKFIWDPDRRGV